MIKADYNYLNKFLKDFSLMAALDIPPGIVSGIKYRILKLNRDREDLNTNINKWYNMDIYTKSSTKLKLRSGQIYLNNEELKDKRIINGLEYIQK